MKKRQPLSPSSEREKLAVSSNEKEREHSVHVTGKGVGATWNHFASFQTHSKVTLH